MDLMTLITTNPYWLRNVCVGLYMPFVMLEWLSPKARFLFMLLSSLFIMQQMNSGPSQKKVVLLIVLPWLPPSSGKLQFEDSLQHFEILQSSMYNPFKLSFE